MPFSSFSFSFSFDDDDGEEGDDIGNHLVTSKRKRNTNRYQCGYRIYTRRMYFYVSTVHFVRYKLTITSVLLILFLVAVIIQSRLDESTASRRRVFGWRRFRHHFFEVLFPAFLRGGRSVIATTRGRRELWTTARFKRGLFNDVRIAVVHVHATTGGGTRPSTSTARSSSSSSSSPG